VELSFFSHLTKGDSMNLKPADDGSPPPKFLLGVIVATPNALDKIPNEEILNALSRHVRGDWGTLDAEDAGANENALQKGGRLFSAYQSIQNVKFWIITEWHRRITTVLLPEDY
jgi:hypothetical protein